MRGRAARPSGHPPRVAEAPRAITRDEQHVWFPHAHARRDALRSIWIKGTLTCAEVLSRGWTCSINDLARFSLNSGTQPQATTTDSARAWQQSFRTAARTKRALSAIAGPMPSSSKVSCAGEEQPSERLRMR
jgi:hypothetical protein